jgi:hypothetical protein
VPVTKRLTLSDFASSARVAIAVPPAPTLFEIGRSAAYETAFERAGEAVAEAVGEAVGAAVPEGEAVGAAVADGEPVGFVVGEAVAAGVAVLVAPGLGVLLLDEGLVVFVGVVGFEPPGQPAAETATSSSVQTEARE